MMFDYLQLKFYISVSKGSEPISGMDVRAYVTYPDGGTLEIILRDSGTGIVIF